MTTEKILNDLLELHKNYSAVLRRTIALDKYNLIKEKGSDVEPQDKSVRESLLEHVGSLPVVATYLYPFLEHKNEIDLGKVLTMLAIHDIGELVVGDEHPHKKSDEFSETERREAFNLLSEGYYPIYDEFETLQTLDAKFAKSVDVFATFLSDQMLPLDYVAKRFLVHEFSSESIFEKRLGVFAWDSFLKELFNEVIERYKKVGV